MPAIRFFGRADVSPAVRGRARSRAARVDAHFGFWPSLAAVSEAFRLLPVEL